MRLSFLLILISVFSINAQSFVVKGRVFSGGAPLEDANVYLNATAVGVTTNQKGAFSISMNARSAALTISYIGYKTKTIVISNGKYDLGIIELVPYDSLEEIVISGTLKQISKLDSPVPVEVYGKAFFSANPTASVFEALENVNGIRPQLNCNVCNTGDIHINGQEGSYTMVLIDGLPIVSGLSTVYGLSGIPQSLIERVEIVKGPASTLYGSEAIGGVINLITKLPENTPAFSIYTFFSGWGEANTDLGYKYRLSARSYGLLGINYYNYSNPIDNNGDGFTDLTLQDRLSIFNKFRFGDNLSVATRFVYEDRWGGQMDWSPKYRGDDQVYGESIYTARIEVFGKYQFNNNLSLQFSFNDHNHNSVYGTTLFNAKQSIGFGQMIWNKTLPKNDFLIGLAYRYTCYDDDTSAVYNNNAGVTHLPGVFVQNETKIDAYNTLLLGLRYDHNSIHGNILTPRINYKINNLDKSAIFRFSAGTGYRVAQVFTEDHAALTGAREVVFVDELAPEKSRNINLNYVKTFYFKQGVIFDIDLSLFHTVFSNKIIPDYDTNPNKIIYDNLDGSSISTGASLNANLVNQNGVRINLGATYIDTYAKAAGVKTRPYLTERFQGVWKIEKKWYPSNLTFDLTGTTTGPLKLPTLSALDPRPSMSETFTIVNIQLTKNWGGAFETFGGVKNMLNFTPPANSISRAFDPFDKQVTFDGSGNVLQTANNPYALTFDPSYVYASNQGIRFYAGVRWKQL